MPETLGLDWVVQDSQSNPLKYFPTKEQAHYFNEKVLHGKGFVQKTTGYFCSAYTSEGGYRRCMARDAMPVDFKVTHCGDADKVRVWLCRKHYPYHNMKSTNILEHLFEGKGENRD